MTTMIIQTMSPPQSQWQSGLCDCSDECGFFFLACMCPCIAFGYVKEEMVRLFFFWNQNIIFSLHSFKGREWMRLRLDVLRSHCVDIFHLYSDAHLSWVCKSQPDQVLCVSVAWKKAKIFLGDTHTLQFEKMHFFSFQASPRNRYNIVSGDCCTDCLLHTFCYPVNEFAHLR